MSDLRPAVLVALGLAWFAGLGCAALGTRLAPSREPLRISEITDVGDPARRASQRLVLRGLDEDAQVRPDVAIAQYERALQVDPTNPFAYLALARHEIDAGAPARGLAFLGKAEALLDGNDEDSRRVEAHVIGLRGAALQALGRPADALPLLSSARRLAPGVWADGRLDAHELR